VDKYKEVPDDCNYHTNCMLTSFPVRLSTIVHFKHILFHSLSYDPSKKLVPSDLTVIIVYISEAEVFPRRWKKIQ